LDISSLVLDKINNLGNASTISKGPSAKLYKTLLQ